MNEVEKVEEGGDVITMDGCHGVVRLAKPEEDDAQSWRLVGRRGARGGRSRIVLFKTEATSDPNFKLSDSHE
jgi:hypothetical protein